MIHDHDRQDIPTYSGKLILPAPEDESFDIAAPDSGEYPLMDTDAKIDTRLRRSQSLRYVSSSLQPPPKQPLRRLGFFWRKDPAYKVLLIAVTCVLLAGLALATLATRAFLQNPNFLHNFASSSQQVSTNVTPGGTVDLKPTFAVPNGGFGSTSSSQPPQSTPYIQPTNPAPQPQPSPSPAPSQLSVQITSIPTSVRNNSIVAVQVNTSEPNVTVVLNIVYNVIPYRSTAGPRTTGNKGYAMIPWNVVVYLFGRHAQAVIVAVATDQNGNTAQSQPVTVQITKG
jgi:hypothetical protein